MKQYIQNFKKFQPLLEELVARDDDRIICCFLKSV